MVICLLGLILLWLAVGRTTQRNTWREGVGVTVEYVISDRAGTLTP